MNTLKQGWIGCFLTLKVYCTYSSGKNVKITQTIAIAVTKHPAKFGIKKFEKKSNNSFYIAWS